MASDYEAILKALADQQAQSFNASPFSQALNRDIQQAADSVAAALMAPGNAVRGAYNTVEIGPDGSVSPFSTPMLDAAANMAGAVSLSPMGGVSPGLAMGMTRPKNFPFSDSLSLPPAPTAQQLSTLGRVERVPLSQARATNSLQWDRFSAGDHPPPMAEGFADRPIAVRKENGEYLIYDGHHRAALAAETGADAIEMYVVDAKDFAPADAGRPSSAPKKWSSADDELLRELGF